MDGVGVCDGWMDGVGVCDGWMDGVGVCDGWMGWECVMTDGWGGSV